MKHVHAELMIQYALTAMETDSPYFMWQCNTGNGWMDLKAHPTWDSGFEYRRKPNRKIVMIDGEELIVPKSFNPNVGEDYWYFNTSILALKVALRRKESYGSDFDFSKIYSGNCYKTKEEAEQAFSFWKKVNEVQEL